MVGRFIKLLNAISLLWAGWLLAWNVYKLAESIVHGVWDSFRDYVGANPPPR